MGLKDLEKGIVNGFPLLKLLWSNKHSLQLHSVLLIALIVSKMTAPLNYANSTPMEVGGELYMACVRSCMIYGSDTWISGFRKANLGLPWAILDTLWAGSG